MTHGDVVNGPDRGSFLSAFSSHSTIRFEVKDPVSNNIEIVFIKINRLTIQDDHESVWFEGHRSDDLLGAQGRYNYESQKGFMFFRNF